MKQCPFCAEDIQDDAIKCRHCNEFIVEKIKWYFKSSVIVIAVLSVGPFALPLIWWHPGLTRTWKIAWTVIILMISWYLFQATMETIKTFDEYSQLINNV